jgi:hypothetical protein
VGMRPLLATWPFVWADYSARQDDPFGAIARQFTDCGSTPGVAGCCDQNRVLKPPLSQWLTGGNQFLMALTDQQQRDLYVACVENMLPAVARMDARLNVNMADGQLAADLTTIKGSLDALKVQIGSLQVPPANLQPVLDAIAALKADLDSLTLKKV